MKNDDAFARLKTTFPGIYKEGANAFGDSSSCPGRMAVVVPLKYQLAEVEEFCKKHEIVLYRQICGSTYGHHYLIKDPDHEWNFKPEDKSTPETTTSEPVWASTLLAKMRKR